MAFMLGEIIIDRVQYAYGEKKEQDGTFTPVLLMSQLSDFTVDISAESKDAVDAQGTLVKRFWQAKTGEVTATNAMINFSSIGAQNGTDPELATTTNVIKMPRIVAVKAGTTLPMPGYDGGEVNVNAMNNSGGMGKSYTLSDFNITDGTGDFAGMKVLTPPDDQDVTQYLVKYERDVTSGARLINEADKFPGTIVLTVKALAIDPCDVNTLKALYIRFPSFQISPELSLSLTTDTTVDFSGSLQADYCGGSEKTLYQLYWADDDSEE